MIHNSESMTIRDDGKESRAEQLQKQFENTGFFKKLNDKFRTRIYRFDQDAERIDNPNRLPTPANARGWNPRPTY